jgi:hypothetical protein
MQKCVYGPGWNIEEQKLFPIPDVPRGTKVVTYELTFQFSLTALEFSDRQPYATVRCLPVHDFQHPLCDCSQIRQLRQRGLHHFFVLDLRQFNESERRQKEPHRNGIHPPYSRPRFLLDKNRRSTFRRHVPMELALLFFAHSLLRSLPWTGN